MKILRTISDFSNNVCPGYDQAGDLASIATLAMYAISIEPIGAIAVSAMLFASIYNTMQMILESVPMIAPGPSKPSMHISGINALPTENLENEFSHQFKNDKDKPQQDKGNIFRL